MSNHPEIKTKSNDSIYYILALVFGMLTAWIVTGSILWVIIGAVLGLLTAGFFVNVLVNKSDEA
ncbi:hypothetical protein GS399_01475 [Pedobacter sp. HMF7647]|uniref:Uncharacterized protein n=1 Tax=Hufsiella arboris TaxID=2695275 RepID=A0A7K1Y4X0_9SPHI|nr:hypothetical protein [Hufsiella arboris]MXV49626.1 hypothetical protein [Hufsiella arboris]